MSTQPECQCGHVHGACATEFQYAVKVVCGEVNADTPNAPAAPGQYWTAINIHSPEKCNDTQFRFKLAVAFQSLENPVSQYYGPYSLGPDAALEIDCPLIRQIYPPPQSAPKFIKGFLVIESNNKLDVVAVYTGAQSTRGPLSTFYTERVQPCCVPVCEDLVLPLNTGTADWQTTASPTAGPMGSVAHVTPVGIWATAPFGSSWVSQNSTDGAGSSASLGVRRYELCFDLCSGFTVPAPFQIQALADDSASVFLNSNLIGDVGTGPGSGFSSPTTLTVTSNNLASLRAGRNCFQVAVTNGPSPGFGPTAFALAGILHVPRGKCPCARLPLVTIPSGREATRSLFGERSADSKEG